MNGSWLLLAPNGVRELYQGYEVIQVVSRDRYQLTVMVRVLFLSLCFYFWLLPMDTVFLCDVMGVASFWGCIHSARERMFAGT